jgi:hypothetical protein
VNFWDLVDAWRAAGRVVVVVTHMLAELTRVDRVVELPLARMPPSGRPARTPAVRRWRRVLAIATAQGRDLLRRRLALLMLATLPALFYLSVAGQHIGKGQDPWNLNIAVIGVAWAVGGGAFFLALSSRRVDQRLLLAGYRRTELVLGRLVFLEAFAFMIAAIYSVLFGVRSSAATGPLILAVAVTALIGVPLGLAVAALLPRELEGTLALIGVIGVQSSLSSTLAIAPALPFYGSIKLVQASWTSAGAIMPYFLHGLLAATLLLALAMLRWSRGSAVRSPGNGRKVSAPPH